MQCTLCRESCFEQAMDIFSDEGISLNVCNIISKYFWFKPNDAVAMPGLSYLCRQCWKSLSDFHSFYEQVEQAHKRGITAELSVNFTEENETCQPPYDNLRRSSRRRSTPKKLPSASGILEFEVLNLKGDVENSNLVDKVLCFKSNVENSEIVDEAFTIKNEIEIPILVTEMDCLQSEADNPILMCDICEEIPSGTKRKRGRPAKTKSMISTCSTEDVKKTDYSKSNQKISSKITKRPNIAIKQRKSKMESRRLAALSNIEEQCGADINDTKPQFQSNQQKRNITVEFDKIIAGSFHLTCCLCQISLADFTELKAHFRSQHQIRGYAYCCGRKFLKRGILVEHIRTHQDPTYFKCSIPECAKVMSSQRALDLHNERHERSPERIYHCDVCSKSYFNRTVFRRHMLQHVPDDQKTFTCQHCDKKFVDNYAMRQHVRLVHLNLYAKVCDICGKLIRGKDNMRRHQEGHAGMIPKPSSCNICGTTCTTKYGLARHIKVMHTEKYLEPQVCQICSKVSPSWITHKRHMRYSHITERKHQCQLCPKAFKRPKELREHISTHTGEVLYTCTYCPQTFKSNANMYAHRKRVHREEWEEMQMEIQRKRSIVKDQTNSAVDIKYTEPAGS